MTLSRQPVFCWPKPGETISLVEVILLWTLSQITHDKQQEILAKFDTDRSYKTESRYNTVICLWNSQDSQTLHS